MCCLLIAQLAMVGGHNAVGGGLSEKWVCAVSMKDEGVGPNNGKTHLVQMKLDMSEQV